MTSLHLTLQQQRVRDGIAFVVRHPSLLGSVTLNRSIHESAVLQSRLSTHELTGRIRAMIGSRRHNAFVTPLETLTDILVHGQDIAVPLGVRLEMLPTASALAATRRWETRGTWMDRVFRTLPLDEFTFTATDADWSRGRGPEVTGPIGELLLLLTGRRTGWSGLTGQGAEALRGVASRSG